MKTTFKLVFILQFLPQSRIPVQPGSLAMSTLSFEHHLHSPSQTLPLSRLREILLPLKDASNGSKSPSKSHSTPNASHSPLGNYSSIGHPFHQLFQRTHQSFHWELQENKGFCFHTNRFCSSVKDLFWASHPFWQEAATQLGAATIGRHLPRVVGA